MRGVILMAAAVAAGPAAAAEIKLEPLVDARLRYEGVEQDGLPRDADAVTLRVRAGAALSASDWQLLAEGEATEPLVDDYNSGLNDKLLRPLVADPRNHELNRLQIRFSGVPKTQVTLGRQRISLQDQRFVGAVGWRQNEQTFDAVRIEWAGLGRLKADVAYSWSVRTIWGEDGRGARQQAVSGDNLFAVLSQPLPGAIGTLSGFAYLVDQDELAVSAFQLSSRTYGLRLAGEQELSARSKLTYAASYARQSDWHRNPNDYAADYWLAELGGEIGPVRLGAGYEVLGADDGRPLTSLQTPLATLHKFQGWADKFTTTPPNGIRDFYLNGGLGWKALGPLSAIAVQAIYHRYDSDRLDLDYGDEIDVLVSARWKKVTLTAKYADYRAEAFATDTRKLWLQLECSL